MSGFHKGDIVTPHSAAVCPSWLTVGKEYAVLDCGNKDHVLIRDDDGDELWQAGHRFTLVRAGAFKLAATYGEPMPPAPGNIETVDEAKAKFLDVPPKPQQDVFREPYGSIRGVRHD